MARSGEKRIRSWLSRFRRSPEAGAQDMARTFDIRFDAAANSFGWSGGGKLSVDTQGMSFALKRGIASLLARSRSQRIPADRIIEVYREGDALRVEFAT